MEKNFKFHDKKWYLVEVELELKDGRFSMSGWYNGSWGQCFDRVEPRTASQEKLIEYWREYHLNDMNAGTKEQSEVIKLMPEWYDYNKTCKFLMQHDIHWNELTIVQYNKIVEAIDEYKKNLIALQEMWKNVLRQAGKKLIDFNESKYTHEDLSFQFFKELCTKTSSRYAFQHKPTILQADSIYAFSKDRLTEWINGISINYPEDIYISAYCVRYQWQPYMYGHWWITYPLPENFEAHLETLIKIIETEEEDYIWSPVTADMYNDDRIISMADELDCSPEKLVALCVQCEIGIDNLDSITHENKTNRFEAEGQDWLVCTDEEADEEHLEDVQFFVDDMWWEWFKDSSNIDVELDEDWDIIVSKKIIIESKDRCHALNRYDWVEYTQKVNGETFYLYKQ